MPPPPAPACSSRILAFYPHRRITGRVALDGFGLVPRSFTAFELRRFAPDLGGRLDVIVGRSIRRFRPAIVVVAATNPRSSLARRAFNHATAFGARTLMIDVANCRRTLLTPPPRGFDKLAQVVSAFLPELAGHVQPDGTVRSIEVRRRLAPVWNAAAAAVVALVGHAPGSAAALLRGDLPPNSDIPSLIAAAWRRVHPENAV